jgi:hypothetical protein
MQSKNIQSGSVYNFAGEDLSISICKSRCDLHYFLKFVLIQAFNLPATLRYKAEFY